MKKWGGQLDIRPSQSKNWGGRVPPVPPGLTPLPILIIFTFKTSKWSKIDIYSLCFVYPQNIDKLSAYYQVSFKAQMAKQEQKDFSSIYLLILPFYLLTFV